MNLSSPYPGIWPSLYPESETNFGVDQVSSQVLFLHTRRVGDDHITLFSNLDGPAVQTFYTPRSLSSKILPLLWKVTS